MRTHRSPGCRVLPALALAGLLGAGPAGAVTVTCGTGSGLAGQTVEISISTANLTGLGVVSYQFVMTYTATQVTATSVATAGTLPAAAGWSAPTVNFTSGRIAVTAAGTTALSGPGSLVKVDFLLNPALINGGSTTLHFTGFAYNEGSPAVTTVDGSITINPTPQITVSPNTGEIVKGNTLQFTVSGSVTPPVTWSTTDPTVATISSTGLLTGVAPGSVRVTAVDNAGHSDTSDGNILIRGMSVTVGSATILQGQSASIPVTVTSLNGLGVRSGQFTISYIPTIATFTSVTTPGGTLLNGYATPTFGAANSVISVDFAGSTDLTGSGVLFYLNFSSAAPQSGFMTLGLQTALFNENLPAVRINGSLQVNPLPTLGVSPSTATLLAGQTQAFTVTGSPVLPLTWSTLNPSVATINSSTGVLTAVAGGVTQVHVVDNVGAQGTSGAITVYDCKLTIPNLTIGQGATAHVPITIDRMIGGLGVYSVQYNLNFTSPWITGAVGEGGLMAAWGVPTKSVGPTTMRLASAGAHALASGLQILEYVDLTVALSTPVSTVIPLTLTNFLFNEGRPIPQIQNGQLTVTPAADVPPPVGLTELSLGAPQPNPASGSARIEYTVPDGGGRVVLAVFGLDGRRVRTLVDESAVPGAWSASWDGADEAGRAARPGLYFVRLEWQGRRLDRKLTLVR